MASAAERADVLRSIDLRSVAPRERRVLLFSVFDSLPEGSVLHVTSGDDLRPLRHELERLCRGMTAWFQSKPDGVYWESLIRRVSPPEVGAGVAAALRRTWPFAKLSAEHVAALCASVRYLPIGRGHVFAEQGLLFPHLGIVASGLVHASVIAPDGKEIVLREHLPGDVLGEGTLFGGGASAVRFASRMEDTVIVLLAAADVRRVCAHDAPAERALTLLVSESNRALVERLAALSAQPIVARFAGALLAYADLREGLNPVIGPLGEMRQGELAAMAGTGRDLIYRAVTQLETDGAIQRNAGRIVALNRRKLERFSHLTKY